MIKVLDGDGVNTETSSMARKTIWLSIYHRRTSSMHSVWLTATQTRRLIAKLQKELAKFPAKRRKT